MAINPFTIFQTSAHVQRECTIVGHNQNRAHKMHIGVASGSAGHKNQSIRFLG